MIEAVNKILKYQYLFRTSIPDPEHAGAVIESSIADYNDRPHYALLGRTPNQAHAGLLFDREAYRDKLRAARLARMEANRRSCDPCLPLDLEDDQDGRKTVVE